MADVEEGEAGEGEEKQEAKESESGTVSVANNNYYYVA